MEETTSNLLTRGVESVIGAQELTKRLDAGETLRVKLGIDPTSPHLHLGRSIPLLKLRDFQLAGHTIVFIVGDFTGVIGDTSDKDSERPMLREAVINENKEKYFAQVGKLLDLEKAEFRYNSEWLAPLTYREIGEHADQFSVADFIARDNIRKRLDGGKRVSLREVLYPLLQGYDSVAVEADVEIGGTDQRFNLLAGRTLQQHFTQEPQAIIMNPLIPGLDGRKMSSSWGNTINLDDSANDMYGKVMSLTDDLVSTYFMHCTRVAVDEIDVLVDSDRTHPRDAKMRLAREIVTLYHGSNAAQEAEDAFVSVFQKGSIPDDTVEIRMPHGSLLVDALLQAGCVSSKSDFKRLVDGGAIRVVTDNDRKVDSLDSTVVRSETYKIGKRRFCRVTTT